MVSQVQNGEQTFIDMNGDPLSGGFVFMYVPNTGTLSQTWTDSTGLTLNTNPIVLDQAGRANIWGVGQYRQVVTDQFGNLQWDKVTESGGFVSGDLVVTGNLTVDGTSNFGLMGTFERGLTVNPPTGSATALTVNGNIAVDAADGAVDLMTGDKIVVRSGDTPGIAFANTTDVLTMGWWEASDSLRAGIMDGTTGHPLQTLVQIFGTGPGTGIVQTFGRGFNVQNGSSPAFTLYNTVDNLAWNMQASSGDLQWGTADGAGNLITELMKLDTLGALTVNGGVFSNGVHTASIGSTAAPWNNMYAAAFLVTSTDVTSELLVDGQLEIVKSVPIRTGPHIGIAASDAKAIVGAVDEEGVGTNYAVLLGVLWKALQELNSKFDAYVAAHP